MWLPSGDPLNPQIGASDLGALQKLEPRTRENDPPALQHIGAIRDAQGLLDILLNQQHRNAFPANVLHDPEYFLHNRGRQPQGGFVKHQEPRCAHQPPANGQHLLLTAAERARFLQPPFAEEWE